MTFNLWLLATAIKENGDEVQVELAPRINFEASLAEWEKTIHISKVDDSSRMGNQKSINSQSTLVNIELVRPLFYKVFNIVLLSGMFIFIVAIFFVQETNTVLEIAIGVLLGLWGIRSVLIPSYIVHEVILDSIILMLYLVLIIILLSRFVFIPAWVKFNPMSNADTPISNSSSQQSECSENDAA